MRVLLLSTYELGHQPLLVASAAGALAEAGHDVRAVDLSLDPLDPALVDWADASAVAVPMHTATRLAVAAAAALRDRRPDLPVSAYGLYAGAAEGFDAAMAGEYEPALVDWVDELSGRAPERARRTSGPGNVGPAARVELGRVRHPRPRRDALPGLDRYARLLHGGREILAGYVEASRGCAHRCKHCPVPVVYDGRIRTVAVETVVADVDQQVTAGARHITFGDPDFLNGPHHSLRVLEAVHDRHPELTFDATIKVEHIVRHAELLRRMAAWGLIFVVSAFESVDDALLDRLDKGHRAADAALAVAILRECGVHVRPSWLPFTPWTTVADVVDLLDFVVESDLVAHVDPVQYTIRLLLPPGSLLLADPETRRLAGPYDAEALTHPWRSPHSGVDELHAALSALVEARGTEDATAVFPEVHAVVARAAAELGLRGPAPIPVDTGLRPPRLSEPWFCCAEPTRAQLDVF